VKRIFDPVHHFIELEPGEARLLDLTPMQRLRRLRQLGLAYFAFPSAEHSRFTHALGALAMGTRAYDGLIRHAGGAGTPERAYERRLVRCALLLHDVGHGPFSHACEAVLGVRHEERTREILALPAMREGIEALDIDSDDVLGLIVGDPSTKYPALRELVSGPNLDADRMDYLLRDAYFTGVVSGRYDADQLVASLRLFERDGAAVVGIDARGVVALESFVVARYMMFAAVYFHHTTRLFERILQDALRELWPDPHALDPIDEFLRWDDFRVLNELRDRESESARALRERIRIYGLAAEFNARPLRRRRRVGRRTVAGHAPAAARCRQRRPYRVGGDSVRLGRRTRNFRPDQQAQRQSLLAQTLRATRPRRRARSPRNVHRNYREISIKSFR